MPEKIDETITRDIRAKIDEGIYPAGTRLPSVGALSKEYLCSAAPARAALESLKNQGIIRSLRGSGYFVLEAAATENGLNFGLIQAGPTGWR